MAWSLKLNCWRTRLAMFQFATVCVISLLQRWRSEICIFLHDLNPFSVLDWLEWFVVLNWPIFPHSLIWHKFDYIILANKLCAFQTDFCMIFKWCVVSSENCLRRLPMTPDLPILAGPGQLWPDQLCGILITEGGNYPPLWLGLLALNCVICDQIMGGVVGRVTDWQCTLVDYWPRCRCVSNYLF